MRLRRWVLYVDGGAQSQLVTIEGNYVVQITDGDLRRQGPLLVFGYCRLIPSDTASYRPSNSQSFWRF